MSIIRVYLTIFIQGIIEKKASNTYETCDNDSKILRKIKRELKHVTSLYSKLLYIKFSCCNGLSLVPCVTSLINLMEANNDHLNNYWYDFPYEIMNTNL